MIKVFAKCIHKGKTLNPSELIENWILFNSRRTIQKDSWWLKNEKQKQKRTCLKRHSATFALKKPPLLQALLLFSLGCGDSQYLGIYPTHPPKKIRTYIFEKIHFCWKMIIFWNEFKWSLILVVFNIHSFIFWWKISQVSSIFGLWSLLQVVKMAPESEAFQFGGWLKVRWGEKR